MKSLRNLALVFAAALITFGATAQTSNEPAKDTKTKTSQPVMKEKTKTTEKKNGTTKTVTKSKPTNKTVKADSTSKK